MKKSRLLSSEHAVPARESRLSSGEPPSVPSTLIEVDSLNKTYGRGTSRTVAIENVSFNVRELEFVSVVGPSGCGKTTLLKCMSGLATPTAGETRLAGAVICEPPSELALVFQDYSRSLFPWLSVRGNIELPLRKRLSASERRASSDEVTKAVGLTKFRDHYPWQLSGGMQQRVAIARALACEPRVLLLDEPFASVDAQTRAELEDLVLSLRRQFGITVILVTHDIDEAVYMADRVVVLGGHPAVVQDQLSVDLPWPRHQVETKAEPQFSELRRRLYVEIMHAHATDPHDGVDHTGDPVATS
jgi:NitT/TauT family transport system ATP-binding protein